MITKVPSVNWLPIGIDISSRPTAKWLNFEGRRLNEPFFHQSVEAALDSNAEMLETDLAELLVVGRSLPRIKPSGLILHISRCGSTLLANAMRIDDSVLMLSEATVIGTALAPVPQMIPHAKELLDCAVRIFASFRQQRDLKLIIKFVSWNVMSWSVIRALWPDVPAVFVIRDPLEVILSNLRGPGALMAFKNQPILSGNVFGWDQFGSNALGMKPEEYCAKVVGRLCYSLAKALDQHCRIIDYQSITSQTVSEMADFFGIDLAEQALALERVMNSYSKDPRLEQSFVRTPSTVGRHGASVDALTFSERWADRNYYNLRSLESVYGFAPMRKERRFE
jgi:hypothetical protein